MREGWSGGGLEYSKMGMLDWEKHTRIASAPIHANTQMAYNVRIRLQGRDPAL